jgi:coproporphyrinogen III oxidase-like Fe-S oxidoreductase
VGGEGGAQPGAAIGESSFIAPADLPFEFMLNALRLNEGFSIDDYRQRTGLEMDSVEPRLASAQERGLLESREGGWCPTELGRRFLNDLQASFLA